MPIKSKEEIFGDDTPGNPRVDISETNPVSPNPGAPTYNSNNRGYADGEAVTAAAMNRAAYAIQLNVEDLDTRQSVLEVDGLQAAYDYSRTIQTNDGPVLIKASRSDEDTLLLIETSGSTSSVVVSGIGITSEEQAAPVPAIWAATTEFAFPATIFFEGRSVVRRNDPTPLHGGAVQYNSPVAYGRDIIFFEGSGGERGIYRITGHGTTQQEWTIEPLSSGSGSTSTVTGTATALRMRLVAAHNGTSLTLASGEDDTILSLQTKGDGTALEVSREVRNGVTQSASTIDTYGTFTRVSSLQDVTEGAPFAGQSRVGAPLTMQSFPSTDRGRVSHLVVQNDNQARPHILQLDLAEDYFSNPRPYTIQANGSIELGGGDISVLFTLKDERSYMARSLVVHLDSGSEKGYHFIESLDNVPGGCVMMPLDGGPSVLPPGNTGTATIYTIVGSQGVRNLLPTYTNIGTNFPGSSVSEPVSTNTTLTTDSGDVASLSLISHGDRPPGVVFQTLSSYGSEEANLRTYIDSEGTIGCQKMVVRGPETYKAKFSMWDWVIPTAMSVTLNINGIQTTHFALVSGSIPAGNRTFGSCPFLDLSKKVPRGARITNITVQCSTAFDTQSSVFALAKEDHTEFVSIAAPPEAQWHIDTIHSVNDATPDPTSGWREVAWSPTPSFVDDPDHLNMVLLYVPGTSSSGAHVETVYEVVVDYIHAEYK